MIDSYFYEGQLRNYLLQFCNIFTGLQVMTGKGECDVPEFISVPVSIGSRDRVVAAIQAGNTQNRPFSVPAMVANMTGLELDNMNRKGVGVVDRRTFLPLGGMYPNDLRSAVRVMPIPYKMSTDLAIIASNTQQMHQILEQLLILFDPVLQIQISDAALDWTKIAAVELMGITNDENFPAGTERRMIMWTLSFSTNIYISAPVDVKDEIVRKITLRIGDLSSLQINEFDELGNLVPFANGPEYGTITVTG